MTTVYVAGVGPFEIRQRQTTPPTQRGMKRFDAGHALSAQPSTQASTNDAMWWEEQIDESDSEFFEPRQTGWYGLCLTSLYRHCS
jgi:hypothetical protein